MFSIPIITFYLRRKCATFLGARTHRNEMKRSIEICLLIWSDINDRNEIINNYLDPLIGNHLQNLCIFIRLHRPFYLKLKFPRYKTTIISNTQIDCIGKKLSMSIYSFMYMYHRRVNNLFISECLTNNVKSRKWENLILNEQVLDQRSTKILHVFD